MQKFYFTLTHLKRWLRNDDEALRQKKSQAGPSNRVLHVLFSPRRSLATFLNKEE